MSIFGFRPVLFCRKGFDAHHDALMRCRQLTLLSEVERLPASGFHLRGGMPHLGNGRGNTDAAQYYTKHFSMQACKLRKANVSHWGMTHNNSLRCSAAP